MAIVGPMPEHTHVERPFQINQFIERSLFYYDNRFLFENIDHNNKLSFIFEDKLILLSMLLNIKYQNYVFKIMRKPFKVHLAYNPRIKLEESSFFKLVRANLFKKKISYRIFWE